MKTSYRYTALISIKGKSFGTFEGFGPKLVIGCFVFVENIELWSGGEGTFLLALNWRDIEKLCSIFKSIRNFTNC